MPSRDPGLPEGTDHIIDTNIDLGAEGGGSGGFGGGGARASGETGSTGSGETTSGSSAFQFDKKDGGSSSSSGGIMDQVKDQISSLKGQAGDRARGFADDGKSKATDFLQTVADLVSDAAGSVEERLGGQYAGVGNRASESIRSLASTLDERSVDDLFEDARAFVQKSPVVAIGIAAVVGFAVARVVRSSISEMRGGETGGGSATGASTGTGAMGGTGNAPTA